MSLFAKAKKARENKKGFTLVELIVVLVILAILAAMLVPALLGWIDKAREKQYVLEARNIVIAAQTIADEAYAAGEKNPSGYLGGKLTTVAKIADATSIDTLTTNLSTDTTADETHHADYTISSVSSLVFTANGKKVTCKMTNGAWDITKVEDATT